VHPASNPNRSGARGVAGRQQQVLARLARAVGRSCSIRIAASCSIRIEASGLQAALTSGEMMKRATP
jgi:hypothetical protein